MSDLSEPTNELTPQWAVTVRLDPDDGVPQAAENVCRALLLTLVHLRADNVILDFTLKP